MRKHSTLDALFTAPRQGILAATLMEPERWWYLSDLARQLGVHHATLQRELARLTRVEILVARKDGNRSYYRANPDSPIFPELRALLTKTAGLADAIKDALQPFATRITSAFVYGSVARSMQVSESDVDLMIIGEVALLDLVPTLRKAEKRIRRPVNPTLYRPDEFTKAAATSDFLREVLDKEKLFVIGSQHDLDGLAQRGARRSPRAHTRRGRRASSGG
jgi:predicted nucleotidyltransferase